MATTSKIPFSVSARTARLIGRENVSNADGAIIELVKNSHDADADDSYIIFENDSLYIIDNGHGMDDDVIRRAWMTIGTNNKEVDPFSPNKRVKSGAKGIGRFALDRLGECVEMFTLPKGRTLGYRWEIDWSAFETDSSARVEDINATLEEIEGMNLRSHLPSNAKEINFSEGGTILKISKLRDDWGIDALKELFGNLELLVPMVETDSFGITLVSDKFPGDLGNVKPLLNDDFDYSLNATYDSQTRKLSAVITRDELDLELIKKYYMRVFDRKAMSVSPYLLKDFEAKSFQTEYDISEILPGYLDDEDLLSQIGNLQFKFLFAKNSDSASKEDRDAYPYKSVEYASRAEWLRRFSGVRIFRDNFRVRPYGDKGNDWLRLGQRQASSPQGAGQRMGAYRVRPGQLAGSVHISRIYNNILEDKSSREGIQENNAFDLLKEITLGVIALIERDRNTVMFNFRQLWKSSNEEEQKKEKGRMAAEQVRQAASDNNSQIGLELAADLANANEVLTGEVKEKDQEIAVLRGLASAGLVTAAVAHELRGMENILATRTLDLRNLLSRYIDDDQLNGVRDAFNPYVLLSEMEHTDKNLQDWLKYALMPLKRDRRKTKTIYLSEYFEHLKGTWDNLLSERQIQLEISNFPDTAAVKMFMIDLDTVFNNLIINAIESFSRRKDGAERKIEIKVGSKSDYHEILFKDNGAGLDASFKSKPEDIFLPQKTSKRDSAGNIVGTGMGMYLIKNVVEENRGFVEIANDDEGFTLSVKLPTFGEI